MTSWRWLPPFWSHCLKRVIKLSKTRRNISWSIVAISFRIARIGSCTVCGPFLHTRALKYPHKKKTGRVRSGDLTGQTHKNAILRSLTRDIFNRSTVTEQVLKWHNIISSSMCRLCPLSWGEKKRSETCQSPLRRTVYSVYIFNSR
jgi:hypothetical protein